MIQKRVLTVHHKIHQYLAQSKFRQSTHSIRLFVILKVKKGSWQANEHRYSWWRIDWSTNR